MSVLTSIFDAALSTPALIRAYLGGDEKHNLTPVHSASTDLDAAAWNRIVAGLQECVTRIRDLTGLDLSELQSTVAGLVSDVSGLESALNSFGIAIDAPPASPSDYDDEFDGLSSVVWSWIRAGAPLATSGIYSEGAGIANGKRWARVINDSAGSYHSVAHQLVQPAPSGDFTLTAKVTAAPSIQYCNFGIVIDDGSDANLTSFYLGVSTAGWSVAALQRVNGTYTFNQAMHGYAGASVYLKIVYRESAARFDFYYSPDNTTWLLAGQQTVLSWQPARFGISWCANNSTPGEYGASVEFFRVTEP